MKSRLCVVLVACLAWSVALPAASLAQPPVAETSAYMWVTANGSLLQGPVQEPGKEDSFQLLAYDHMIERPYDPETGQITGYPIHHPITIKKEVDQTSPLLYRALADNQDIDLVIHFFRMDGQVEQRVYTIETWQGRMVNIQESIPDLLDPWNTDPGFFDTCAFVYRTIRWIWEEGGIIYEMDWQSTSEANQQFGLSEDDLALMPPWPNPATGKANFRLALPMGTDAKLQVFDLSGRKIKELHDGELNSWTQEFVWDGRNQRGDRVAKGVYQVRLSWDGKAATKQVIWLR